MLSQFGKPSQAADELNKLWALPVSVASVLIGRGMNPKSVADATDALASVEAIITPGDAISAAFRPRSVPPTFGTGRFGAGTYPVFYSALSEETCVAEVRHRAETDLAGEAYSRHYKVLKCQYAGLSLNLVGYEDKYPDLISKTISGYPFCQAIAAEARASDVDALYSRSARHGEGVCVPVFAEASIAAPRIEGSFRFSRSEAGIVVERTE